MHRRFIKNNHLLKKLNYASQILSIEAERHKVLTSMDKSSKSHFFQPQIENGLSGNNRTCNSRVISLDLKISPELTQKLRQVLNVVVIVQQIRNNIQFISQEKAMQTLQQKLKAGYSITKRTVFTGIHKQSIRPSKCSISIKKRKACLEELHTNSSEHSESDSHTDTSSNNKKPALLSGLSTIQNFQNPYSSIGLIACDQAGQKVMGTGFLVGPNLVLTSAQNVWSFKEKKVGSNVTFWMTFKNNSEGVIYSAKKISVPEELQTATATADELLLFNFAIVQLQCGNLEHEFGAMALTFEAVPIFNEDISVIGFSCYGKSDGLCELVGKASSQEGLIKYDMNTGYGMCGAPIIRQNEGRMEVIGIHVYSRYCQGKNEKGGLMFDARMLSYLEKWCMQQEEEMNLREMVIGREGVKLLSKRKWNNLTSINLSRNNLESSSAKYLRTGNWRNVINFDLGGNSIRKDGAQALVLSELTAVTTLNLWGNFIGKRGAYCLSLSSWKQLTNLNLYNNDIGDDGVEWLIKANWRHLNNLNLGRNGITEKGAEMIMEGIWTDLVSLNLWGNNFCGEEDRLKSLFLQHYQQLKYLYL